MSLARPFKLATAPVYPISRASLQRVESGQRFVDHHRPQVWPLRTSYSVDSKPDRARSGCSILLHTVERRGRSGLSADVRRSSTYCTLGHRLVENPVSRSNRRNPRLACRRDVSISSIGLPPGRRPQARSGRHSVLILIAVMPLVGNPLFQGLGQTVVDGLLHLRRSQRIGRRPPNGYIADARPPLSGRRLRVQILSAKLGCRDTPLRS